MNKKRRQGTFIVSSFISNPKEHSEKKDIAEEIGIQEKRYEVVVAFLFVLCSKLFNF